METATIPPAVEVVRQTWLTMENGRRLYAHVIGLDFFTRPREADKPTSKVN